MHFEFLIFFYTFAILAKLRVCRKEMHSLRLDFLGVLPNGASKETFCTKDFLGMRRKADVFPHTY